MKTIGVWKGGGGDIVPPPPPKKREIADVSYLGKIRVEFFSIFSGLAGIRAWICDSGKTGKNVCAPQNKKIPYAYDEDFQNYVAICIPAR